MNLRRPKARITDFRPPSAGASPPLERGSARPEAAAWKKSADRLDRVAREHDEAIATYSPATLIAAAKDLWSRGVWDKKNHEHRWILDRRAALLRRIDALKLTPADA